MARVRHSSHTADEPAENLAGAPLDPLEAESPPDTTPGAHPNGGLDGDDGGTGPTDPAAPTPAAGRTATGLPTPPKRCSIETMMRWLGRLSTTTQGNRKPDWEHLCVYLYRLWPVIIRPERQSHIRKFYEPFTLDEIQREFGEGRYQLRVNDTDIKGSFKTVADCLWTYTDPENPPKILLNELNRGHDDNRDYVESLKRQGKLDAQGEIVQPNNSTTAENTAVAALAELAKQKVENTGKPGPQIETTLLSEVIKTMGAVNSESVRMAMKQADPEHLLKLAGLIKDTLGGPAPANHNNQEAAVVTILRDEIRGLRDELKEERAANRKLQEQMLERLTKSTSAEARPNPLAMVREVLELRDTLAGDLNPEAQPRNWREALAQGAVAQLPEFLGVLKLFAGSLNRGQPPLTSALPRGNPGHPAAPPPPAPPPPDEPSPGGELGPVEELKRTLLKYGSYFLNAFEEGTGGDAFADSLITILKRPAYNRLTHHPPEIWVQAIAQIPELADYFKGQEKQLAEFLEQFYAFGTDNPEEIAEPEPAKPKKEKR